ncbi:MAG TPA: hypothetical protein VFF65_05550, partial [Phycisphaerales bacterium]|nr:hypothetical protein [Phycisphaerales bacterium]
WTASNGYTPRIRAINLLAEDPLDPDGTDTRAMLSIMMGPEPDWAVIEHVCKLAADRGWTDLTPVLVRQLAKVRLNTPDADRPEWAALTRLHPGKPMEDIAFDVFAAPEGAGLAKDRTERAREAAWQLLTRLDKDGSRRRELMGSMAAAPAPAMADVRTVATDLGAIPLTAEELSWVRTLRKPENAAWWAQAKAAVAALPAPARQGLSVRHAEPVRWAAANEPSWLTMGRDELAAVLTERLKGRELFLRGDGGGDAGRGSERLSDNIKRMTWGDVLSLLVVDQAVRTPGLAERLAVQADEDQRDTTTEYGGYIGAAPSGAFAANLYAPRPTQRFSDTRFVASDELLTNGATALAVYHFHAQKHANAEFAGPSGGDVDYARDSGRLCLVFTPVREGVFNVDAYFGDRVRCDLGTIGGGAKASR